MHAARNLLNFPRMKEFTGIDTPDHVMCRCALHDERQVLRVREIAPRSIVRALECVGGPIDGETRDIPADDNTLHFPDGSYVTSVITERGAQSEVLLYRAE